MIDTITKTLHWPTLAKRCTMKPANTPGERIGTPQRPAWFLDHGSDILAVAHLDYIPQTRHFSRVVIRERKYSPYTIIYSGQLDNRLGAWIVLDVLPQLIGMNAMDILLTTDEERCQSTASQFISEKHYKWIVSFDRAGVGDVAMYQYISHEAATKAVASVGLEPVRGSYSDIAELGHLGCAGFNWFNGLQAAHSATAHVSEPNLLYSLETFLAFWELYHDTTFAHTQETVLDYGSDPWDYDDFYLGSCDSCRMDNVVVAYHPSYDAFLCEACAATVTDDTWANLCDLCGSIAITEPLGTMDICEACLAELDRHTMETMETMDTPPG